MKLDKVRYDMFAISNKLKKQCLIWQNCLAQLDSLTKNHLGKEQVLTEEAKPTVVAQWDPTPDVEGKEGVSDETQPQQVLPPRKWNKGVEVACRIDIHITIEEDNDIEEFKGNCDVGCDSDANSSNSESEGGPSEAKIDSDSNSEYR